MIKPKQVTKNKEESMNSKKSITAIITIALLLIFASLTAAPKAYIGVYLSDMDESKYENLGMKNNYGIMVNGVVDDSPAEDAGMKADDVILEFASEKIYTKDQLTKMLKGFDPGKNVKIKIWRNGKTQKIKLKLGDAPDPFKRKTKAYLGVYLENINKDDYDKLGLNTNFGIEIAEVVDGGAAAKAGLKAEDILLSLNDDKIYTTDQLSKMLLNFNPEDKVNLEIFRDGNSQNFEVVLGEKEVGLDFFVGNMFQKPESIFFYKYKENRDKGIGIMAERLTADELIEMDIENGVAIVSITRGSPAEKAELKVKDIIITVGDKNAEDVATIHEIIDGKEIGEEITVTINRGGDLITKIVEIDKLADSDDEMSNIKILIENGELRMNIDGDESKILDFNEMLQGFKHLKNLDKLDSLKELEGIKNIKFFDDPKSIDIEVITNEEGEI